MSESEDFLARWSRLKRESALAMSAGECAPVAPQVVDEQSTSGFDPASLPSIGSIDAATDIRPFLEACVPEELTRAALRTTWSADPAIRDFIGIAENQWDFNDPTTIPGFGVHAAADYLGSLAVHAVGSLDSVVEIAPGCVPMADPPTPVSTTATGSDAADVVTSASEGDPGVRIARSHGGALPE